MRCTTYHIANCMGIINQEAPTRKKISKLCVALLAIASMVELFVYCIFAILSCPSRLCTKRLYNCCRSLIQNSQSIFIFLIKELLNIRNSSIPVNAAPKKEAAKKEAANIEQRPIASNPSAVPRTAAAAARQQEDPFAMNAGLIPLEPKGVSIGMFSEEDLMDITDAEMLRQAEEWKKALSESGFAPSKRMRFAATLVRMYPERVLRLGNWGHFSNVYKIGTVRQAPDEYVLHLSSCKYSFEGREGETYLLLTKAQMDSFILNYAAPAGAKGRAEWQRELQEWDREVAVAQGRPIPS